MTHTLKDGSTVEDRKLDRLIQFDEKSRLFRAVEGIEEKPERSYSWNKTVWLDQRNEGACVGFGLAHELAARPVVIGGMSDLFARERLYWEAQKIDPWEGGAYPSAFPFYEGTSVLAGLKVLQSLGYLDEYRWAFGEKDLALTIGYQGPAVLGIPWYEGMYEPDGDGFIHAEGELMGYHCILAPSLSLKMDAYRLDNSWGLGWGINGSCWVSRSDMREKLLPNQGEAAVLVRRTRPPGP